MRLPSDAAPAPLAPFTDASMVRRIHGEGVLILGGGRALLLQIAHPSVARAVAEHSRLREDGFGRLVRTLRLIFALVYGSPAEARSAAARINGVHARVVGEGYRALDPELLAWVLATLVDTALVMRERFVAPLSPAEEQDYYDDMRALGALLGMPEAALPAHMPAFRDYFDAAIETLEVTDLTRELARHVFPLWPPQVAPAMVSVRQLTAGLLPPALREAYGMSWGPLREAALRGLALGSRTALPFVPRAVRRTPRFLLPPSYRR